ncbi:insulinase family protein [Planosporangium flavigriseum]|uniref:Putative zinc protease n=1 Tax=Planosporangium flavigriseum TaxID=373681 RepID=A0A8J3LTE5_9ACTN|nr:pitrilysin family protein [Planosporangium flavigriseum]NJC64059.1 insulinase family protein [Planosporangium flavigriseum]GIG72940.1 putative zinc protease [Planosporangium flavigriseum]
MTHTPKADALGGTVRRTVLPSGLRVLTEAIPAMRSVSFGVWVSIGSRDETPELSGASHFLEHLLFKGTRRRTALDISAEIEAVGGETNAFTAKEYTCYYARVLDADLPLAIDVMCDLVADSVLTEADVETERGVILEEIAMVDDEPGDEVHDIFAEAVYGDHPLGRRISGTPETIAALTRDQIMEFYRSRYAAPTVVVTAAGNLDHDEVVARVAAAFEQSPYFNGAGAPAPGRARDLLVPVAARQVRVQNKDTEQAHVVLGCGGLARDDERRFALGALNNVLGGGMSSRLFQQIRERRGLAYSVYSYTSQFADSGLFAVYAGCAPGKVDEVLSITRDELAKVAAEGVSDAEVARGKGMLKGSLVLGLEDTGSRMSRLGKGELLYRRMLSVDELLARIDAVTPEDVRAVAAEVLSNPSSLAVIGPFDDPDFSGIVE